MGQTIELLQGSPTDLAVRRGRDASARLADLVRDAKARGEPLVEVRVSPAVADAMRAFFAATFRGFDGVLPHRVLGVPFAEGDTGGADYQVRTRAGRQDVARSLYMGKS
jgi:hypothetical protein